MDTSNAALTWNQMQLMGLLIQNSGSTQKPLKTYHKMMPSHASTPDSEGLLMMPTITNVYAVIIILNTLPHNVILQLIYHTTREVLHLK